MITKETATQSGTVLETVIIFTRRMEELAAFYQETLDLAEFERSPDHMGIQIGPVYLGFDQVDQGEGGQSGVSLWFTVDNIQDTFERMVETGARVRYQPTLKPWGGHLAAVYDPDGNMIGLSQRES